MSVEVEKYHVQFRKRDIPDERNLFGTQSQAFARIVCGHALDVASELGSGIDRTSADHLASLPQASHGGFALATLFYADMSGSVCRDQLAQTLTDARGKVTRTNPNIIQMAGIGQTTLTCETGTAARLATYHEILSTLHQEGSPRPPAVVSNVPVSEIGRQWMNATDDLPKGRWQGPEHAAQTGYEITQNVVGSQIFREDGLMIDAFMQLGRSVSQT